jgi:hypothetical protein
VFAIDIEVCRRCGGKQRVIASVEEPATIERILEHLGGNDESVDPAHPSRALLHDTAAWQLGSGQSQQFQRASVRY